MYQFFVRKNKHRNWNVRPKCAYSFCGGFKYFLMFIFYLGRWSNLTNILALLVQVSLGWGSFHWPQGLATSVRRRVRRLQSPWPFPGYQWEFLWTVVVLMLWNPLSLQSIASIHLGAIEPNQFWLILCSRLMSLLGLVWWTLLLSLRMLLMGIWPAQWVFTNHLRVQNWFNRRWLAPISLKGRGLDFRMRF